MEGNGDEGRQVVAAFLVGVLVGAAASTFTFLLLLLGGGI